MTAPNPAAHANAILAKAAEAVALAEKADAFLQLMAETHDVDNERELVAAVPQLAAALREAVTALEFYGDEGKWGDDGPIGTRLDYGWIAQDALRRMAGGEDE